jgi:nucleoside-diphosphate-sugar epimerase
MTGLRTVAVTGGAGYIGALVVEELLSAGHRVRVLDALVHGQRDVADALRAAGAELSEEDILEGGARERLLDGAAAVVHLAAIVGDPACAGEPERSWAVNVEASRERARDARRLGVGQLIFASTCSNYGRMMDATAAVDETGELRPVSAYAEQKVTVERELLSGAHAPLLVTCLRFATVYGVGRRMRFDLTVNEFSRDLWAARRLEVYGEQFWRPYVHVRDAARAVRDVLAAPAQRVAGEVFNVGDSAENYRKADLVRLITGRLGRGDVRFVHRAEDPRDYRVSFEKIRDALGFEPAHRVPDGIDEVLAALGEGRFGDPFHARYSNV